MKGFWMYLAVFAIFISMASFVSAQSAPQEDRVFEGQLVSVDATAKTMVLIGADNKDMTFSYTDQTVVTGSEKSVQGLSGKAGTPLKVTYKTERGANNAIRIEAGAAKAAPAPPARP
jgi:hypothetical protein